MSAAATRSMQRWRRAPCVVAAGLVLMIAAAPGHAAGAAASQQSIALQLFSRDELAQAGLTDPAAEACPFLLHQADRDPGEHVYAIVLFRPEADGAADDPGYLQVGGEFLAVFPAADSGVVAGTDDGAVRRMLWRGEDGALWVILDLVLADGEASDRPARIGGGTMTVLRGDAAPFRVGVAGAAGCH